MNKRLGISLAAIALALSTILLAGCPSKHAKSVRIVAILSTLGKPAAYGKDNQAGLEIAKEQFAKDDAHGLPIEVTYEATDGTPESMNTLIRKYANDPSYVCILGPTTTDEATTAANLLTQLPQPLPMLSIGSSGQWLPNGGQFNEWTFRSTRVDTVIVPDLLRAAQKKYKVHRAVMIYHQDNEWSMSVKPVYENACRELGIDLVAEEAASKGASDWSAQLTKVKGLNPDLIIVNCMAGPAPKVVAQARDMGIKTPCIGTAGFTNPQTWTTAGTALDGVLVGDIFDPEADTQEVKDFVAAYKAKYKQTPPAYAAYAYAGYTLFVRATRSAKDPTDRKQLRDSLGALKDIPTVLGTVSYSGKGDITQHPVISEIKGGAYHRLQ